MNIKFTKKKFIGYHYGTKVVFLRGDKVLKTLIIAEKPDMGRNIAAAIDPKAKKIIAFI